MYMGLGLTVAGLLWNLDMPIIKRICTGSMTLFSGGLCFLTLALFCWWVDVKGHSRGPAVLNVECTNSIVAYMPGGVVNVRAAVDSGSYGVAAGPGE